ncbi:MULTISPECIES: hypothetical protein [Campylobacter]|uniref:hypothetical protein n=1 Tax=Campylobacter TaxID=194 RepID=UPI000A33C0F4|nr:hypothetical protein [Campylobacter sp. P0124]MCR8696959.1 hypothetical protein [Campylobacter sp. RM19073]MEE3776693.1 hypothetical protein [Campylobacter sp. CX2-4080-23]
MRVIFMIWLFLAAAEAQDLNSKYKYILDLYNKLNSRANLVDINQVKSPFFIEKINHSKPDLTPLNLEAIIQNRAKINSKWYEAGKEYENLYIIEIKNSTASVIYDNRQMDLKILESSSSVEVY